MAPIHERRLRRLLHPDRRRGRDLVPDARIGGGFGQHGGVIGSDAPVGHRLIDDRELSQPLPETGPPGDRTELDLGLTSHPFRGLHPEAPIGHPTGPQLAQHMGLSRPQRGSGRLELDRTGQQLVIGRERHLIRSRLAALLREIGGVEHEYDGSSKTPSDQHE